MKFILTQPQSAHKSLIKLETIIKTSMQIAFTKKSGAMDLIFFLKEGETSPLITITIEYI